MLQGFGGGTAAKLGVDYKTLRALNPKLIYCEVSGYGREGPLGNAPGYDVMLQAFSGMLSTMGVPGGDFARASFSPVDLGTGMHALSGILAALIERGKTGEGMYLEVSLLDTALGMMGYVAQNYWFTGQLPQPMGTGHPAMAPYQAFKASDGALMIGVGIIVLVYFLVNVAYLVGLGFDVASQKGVPDREKKLIPLLVPSDTNSAGAYGYADDAIARNCTSSTPHP